MCAVSAMGDHYGSRLPEVYPWISPHSGYPPVTPPVIIQTIPPEVSRTEFDALKRDVEEMLRILKVAKKYDEDTGQKDCEKPEKVKLLKDIAKLVGVDLYDVLASE